MARLIRFAKFFRRDEEECLTTRKLSSEYLESELPQSRMQAIRDHLDGCAPCRAFINGLEHTIGLLGRLPRSQPRQSLKQSIIERTSDLGRDKGHH